MEGLGWKILWKNWLLDCVGSILALVPISCCTLGFILRLYVPHL